MVKLISICKVDEWGRKSWMLPNGNFHREDGPAMEYSNGDKVWFLYGEIHRDNEPAVIYHDGEKRWYQHNRLHREDGPAIEYADGGKVWYLRGKKISCTTQEEFERLMNLRAFW
jgi:hypothetical protein